MHVLRALKPSLQRCSRAAPLIGRPLSAAIPPAAAPQDLAVNHLEGPQLDVLSSLTALEHLSLSGCPLGRVPPVVSCAACTLLRHVLVRPRGGALTGRHPPLRPPCTQLTHLADNLLILYLHGIMPPSLVPAADAWEPLRHLKRLRFLSISENGLRELPPAVAGMELHVSARSLSCWPRWCQQPRHCPVQAAPAA